MSKLFENAKPQPAADVRQCQAGDRLIMERQDLMRIARKQVAAPRQRDGPAARSLEDRSAHPLLEALDLQADGGLGPAQEGRRRRKASRPLNEQERSKKIDIEIQHIWAAYIYLAPYKFASDRRRDMISAD